MAWFWSDAHECRHVTIKGMEYIEQLEREGKGALMVAVHSMNLELGARLLVLKVGYGGLSSQ